MPDDVLIRVDRHPAVAAEVLARAHRQAEAVVVAELLDALVEAPEPPRHPAAAALEKRRLERGEALEHAAGQETAERHHLLDSVGHRVRHHEVVHEAPAQVLLVGHLDPVKRHRHAEAHGLGPDGVVARVVPGPAVHRMIREHERDRAELAHAPPRFLDRQLRLVQRQQRRRLQPRAVGRAEIGEPVVEGAADRGREVGLEPVDADQVGAPRAKHDGNVDPFAVHGLEHRARVVARQVLGGVLVAAHRQVARARLLSSDEAQPPALRAVEEGGEDLTLELPAVGVRPVDRREAGRPVLEPGLDVLEPEVVRLVDVDVAVHDLELTLGHRDLPSGGAAAVSRGGR